MAKTIVAGDMYQEIDGQLFEIKRQIRQPGGYPFNPHLLKVSLQAIIEGRFFLEQLPVLNFATDKETNISEAIAHSERFAREVLGSNVDIRKEFDLPAVLPWKNVLVIYDPGFDNRKAVVKALKGNGLKGVYEESDVMEYSGSEASAQPTLRIIENSLRPTEDTLGDKAKSPDELKADGRLYLDQRGYILAFGLSFFSHKDHLDPETWTWFPENRLPSGGVGRGYWNPAYRQVGFRWGGSACVDPFCGARLAIECKRKLTT